VITTLFFQSAFKVAEHLSQASRTNVFKPTSALFVQQSPFEAAVLSRLLILCRRYISIS